MKTIRDHIASQPSMPAPPPGATHTLVWEGSGSRRWELVALDDRIGASGPVFDGPADASPEQLAGFASSLLGCPVSLSARIDIEDEAGYYVTPAGGGR